MITTAIIVLLVAAAGLAIVRAARGAAPHLSGREQVQMHLLPVYLPAFLNLIDAGQQQFLRRQLAPAQFRAVERHRSRVLLIYVKRIAANSAVLMRWADAARGDIVDYDRQKLAKEIFALALRTRLFALLAMMSLYVGLVSSRLATVLVNDTATRYEALTSRQHAFSCASRSRTLF